MLSGTIPTDTLTQQNLYQHLNSQLTNNESFVATPSTSRKRLKDIDRAKGLAIFLVVLGHLAVKAPQGNEWYDVLKYDFIYMFHMPFFVFISGFVTFYTYSPINSFKEYGKYAWEKFTSLAPAYVLLGLLILIGKLLLQNVIYVGNPPASFMDGLVQIITRPMYSCARQIWYLYVLFFLCVLLPILLKIVNQNLWILLAAALVLHFIPATEMFALNLICEYLFVFLLSGYAAAYYGNYIRIIEKYKWYFGCLFLLSFLIPWVNTNYAASKLIIGLCSIPALHSLVRTWLFKDSRMLEMLGRYTLSIYLFHLIAAGLIKGLLLKFVSLEGYAFLYASVLMFLGGLCLPIILKKYLLVRIPILDRITH
jgi:fucose 4-O-acetylase-like acetyltransferase